MKTQIEALPKDRQLSPLRELLRPERYPITLNNEKALGDRFPSLNYDGYIEDPKFRSWVVDQYTSALAGQLGQDDGTPEYQAKARATIEDINKNTAGITQLSALSIFADKVNAQQALAYHIRDIYQSYAIGEALSQHMAAIVGELQVNETSNDPELRNLVLEFLANPLTKESTKPLLEYVKAKYSWATYRTAEVVAEYQLQNYHKNFWAASLEMRTVYLEKIVFPLHSSDEQQKDIIKKLIDDAFPIKGDRTEKERNANARQIVTSYLDSADLAERRLLATAMLAANMHEEGAPEPRLGQKLHTVLSHLGPAGGKLLQAIHSHPQTPKDIKRDLASSKTMYDPPLRWDVVQAVEDSGLLAADHPNRVTHIGKLAGAGSFGITVFNTIADGRQIADTFLRPHAADRAEREFRMMSEAAAHLVQRNPSMKPLVGMVEEARRSARIEPVMSVAIQANQLAEQAYQGIKVTVEQDGKTYDFSHDVTKLIDHGTNFKRMTIAPGVHFNDLPETTDRERSYKKAAAKAIVAAQLSLRLSGIRTDLDRHGGNVKVERDSISHFDFGAMNLVPITEEDKTITGKILARVIRDTAISGKNFDDALLERIEEVEASDATRMYLGGLKKDFLALGDYINALETKEAAAIFARCLTAKTLDPVIRDAFNKEMGMAKILVNGQLNAKAASAGITIERKNIGLDDAAMPDGSRIKGGPEIEKGENIGQARAD